MLDRGQGREDLKGGFRRNGAIIGYFVKMFKRGAGGVHTAVQYRNRWGLGKGSWYSPKLFNIRITMRREERARVIIVWD